MASEAEKSAAAEKKLIQYLQALRDEEVRVIEVVMYCGINGSDSYTSTARTVRRDTKDEMIDHMTEKRLAPLLQRGLALVGNQLPSVSRRGGGPGPTVPGVPRSTRKSKDSQ